MFPKWALQEPRRLREARSRIFMGTLEQVGGIVTAVLRYNLADLFQTFFEDTFGPQSLFHFGYESLKKVFEAKCENRSGRYRQGLKNCI